GGGDRDSGRLGGAWDRRRGGRQRRRVQRPDHGECYAGYGNSGEARDQCSPRGPVCQTQHHVLWDGLAAVTFVGRRQFPFTVLGPNIVSIGLSAVRWKLTQKRGVTPIA